MKHLGQTKEWRSALTVGLRIVIKTSVKTLTRAHQAEEAGSAAGPEPGCWVGASNKHTFCKVSQLGFRGRNFANRVQVT